MYNIVVLIHLVLVTFFLGAGNLGSRASEEMKSSCVCENNTCSVLQRGL